MEEVTLVCVLVDTLEMASAVAFVMKKVRRQSIFRGGGSGGAGGATAPPIFLLGGRRPSKRSSMI